MCSVPKKTIQGNLAISHSHFRRCRNVLLYLLIYVATRDSASSSSALSRSRSLSLSIRLAYLVASISAPQSYTCSFDDTKYHPKDVRCVADCDWPTFSSHAICSIIWPPPSVFDSVWQKKTVESRRLPDDLEYFSNEQRRNGDRAARSTSSIH